MRDKIRQILFPVTLLGMLAGIWCVAWIDANTNLASYLAGDAIRLERTDRAPVVMMSADDSHAT